ncbi:MAG: hypothetical protein ABIC95_02815 [archaeon]
MNKHLSQELWNGGLGELEIIAKEIGFDHFKTRHYRPTTTFEAFRDIHFPDQPLILGIFGSAFEIAENQQGLAFKKIPYVAEEMAKAISKYRERVIIVTGACPDNSIPSLVAKYLKIYAPEIPIIGISPDGNFQNATQFGHDRFKHLKDWHDFIIYTDYHTPGEHDGFRMRDGVNVEFVDGAIATMGTEGTKDEIAGLMECGKVVGLLTSYGGITDYELDSLKFLEAYGKHYWVAYQSPDIHRLVDLVVGQLAVDRHLRHGTELTTLDLYDHINGSKDHIEDLGMLRKSRPDPHFKLNRDRHYPLAVNGGSRWDVDHQRKLVIASPKEEVESALIEIIGAEHLKVLKDGQLRTGEFGTVLLPNGINSRSISTKIHEVTSTYGDKLIYNRGF